MIRSVVLIILIVGTGCSSTPEPFEVGRRTSAPFGYNSSVHKGGFLTQQPNREGVSIGLWSRLQRIHGELKEHFFYLSDKDKYGKAEYWATPSESTDNRGHVSGDCEDFALAAQYRCKEAGITNSRLVLCKVRGKGAHVVLEVEGFILDNRLEVVVGREYLNYEWIKIQDYDGKWRAIK